LTIAWFTGTSARYGSRSCLVTVSLMMPSSAGGMAISASPEASVNTLTRSDPVDRHRQTRAPSDGAPPSVTPTVTAFEPAAIVAGWETAIACGTPVKTSPAESPMRLFQ